MPSTQLAVEEKPGDIRDMEAGPTEDVGDVEVGHQAFDPLKFMDEARAEFRAYIEESMRAIDKSVERMIAPPGERLQNMEQQQIKLAARCFKTSNAILG